MRDVRQDAALHDHPLPPLLLGPPTSWTRVSVGDPNNQSKHQLIMGGEQISR